MTDINYTNYLTAYYDSALLLLSKCFHGEDYTYERLCEWRPNLRKSIMAFDDDRLVGIGCYDTLEDKFSFPMDQISRLYSLTEDSVDGLFKRAAFRLDSLLMLQWPYIKAYDSESPGPKKGDVYFHSLAVDPGYRGQGIGTTLVRYRESLFPGRRAWTECSHQSNSLHIYEQQGYEKVVTVFPVSYDDSRVTLATKLLPAPRP